MLIMRCMIHFHEEEEDSIDLLLHSVPFLTRHISATVQCVVYIGFWHFNRTQISLFPVLSDAFKSSICLYCEVKSNQWVLSTAK